MGILDRIMDGMHLSGDEYEDEFEDDYGDGYEEKHSRGKIFGSKKDFDYDLPDDVIDDRERVRPVKTQSSKVRAIHPKKGGNSMEVCVFKPTRFEESREITDTLLNNCTVVLNFEGLDVEVAQRIIDFTSGSCYAIEGNLQKVSNYIVIVTPKSVDISGDFQEILSGAFDIPNI